MASLKRRFELIVFDWDGTLMDSHEQIVASFVAACGELDLEPPGRDAIIDIIGLGMPEALEALFPGAGTVLHAHITGSYRRHFLESRVPAGLFPGAHGTLSELRAAGYLLAIATGKGRRGLDRSLEATACGHLFHATRCADESFSKPHPQMLLDLMDVLGSAPERTLMVGDTEYDLQMAGNAGTAALAVDYGAHDRERLLRHRPLGCINAIADIKHWLGG
jgi:phosphoglycolate phosphatase